MHTCTCTYAHSLTDYVITRVIRCRHKRNYICTLPKPYLLLSTRESPVALTHTHDWNKVLSVLREFQWQYLDICA